MNGSRLPRLWGLAAILRYSFSEGCREGFGCLTSSIATKDYLVVHSDVKPFPSHIVFPKGGWITIGET